MKKFLSMMLLISVVSIQAGATQLQKVDEKKGAFCQKRLHDIALNAVTAFKLTKSDRQDIKYMLNRSNKKQFFQIIQPKLMELQKEHKSLRGTVAGIIPEHEYNLLKQIYTNAQGAASVQAGDGLEGTNNNNTLENTASKAPNGAAQGKTEEIPEAYCFSISNIYPQGKSGTNWDQDKVYFILNIVDKDRKNNRNKVGYHFFKKLKILIEYGMKEETRKELAKVLGAPIGHQSDLENLINIAKSDQVMNEN